MLWKARSRIDIIQSIGRLKEILPETTVFNHLSRVLYRVLSLIFLWSGNSTAVYCESASDPTCGILSPLQEQFADLLLPFIMALLLVTVLEPVKQALGRLVGRTFVSLA